MTHKTIFLALGLMGTSLIASGCVSSTLDANQFRAVGASERSDPIVAQAKDGEAVSSQALEPVALSPQADAAGQSTTTQSNDPLSTDQANGPDPTARANAIAEMRAKAAAGSGQKTQLGALPETATEALTAQEQAEKIRELNASANNDVVSDAELAEKQKSINLMRKKARRHYKDALNRIER